MAAIGGTTAWLPSLHLLPPCNSKFIRSHGFHCCSNINRNGKSKGETQTPASLKMAVGGVTELLRLLSPAAKRIVFMGIVIAKTTLEDCSIYKTKIQASTDRKVLLDNERENEIRALSVNEVLSIIKSDYENAYFVTGLFTSAIYDEDCTFEDPTIKFQGRELYARNLRLLVPFFDNPSIHLKEIKKGLDREKGFIVASWSLRTHLKLPWTPLVSVDGKTIYDLDEEFRIIRHVERWNISALEAIIQIFTPNFGRRLDQ